MATQSLIYGTLTNFALVSNLNSLANGQAKPLGKVSTSGMSPIPTNFRVKLKLVTGTGSGSTTYISIYLVEALEDTTAEYTDGINPAGTSNIAASIRNAKLIRSIPSDANSLTHVLHFDLVGSGFPNPIYDVPAFWTLVVLNQSGAALAASGHDADYTSINPSIS